MPCARCMFAPMLCIVATDSYKIDHHIGEQLIESQTHKTPYPLRARTRARMRFHDHSQSSTALRRLHSSFVRTTSDNRQRIANTIFFFIFIPSLPLSPDIPSASHSHFGYVSLKSDSRCLDSFLFGCGA